MHILILVHFNATQGGLHENVFSTVKHCLNNKHDVTVVCRDGVFAKRLVNNGAQVIPTNYKDIKQAVDMILKAKKNDYNIIHTHPGPSRAVATLLVETLNIPFFMTFHGMWRDSIGRYVNKLDAIFPVSEGVKEYIRKNIENHLEKMIIMPNGVNKKLYRPRNKIFTPNKNKHILNISLVTRLDKDKDFIFQIFYKALKYTFETYQQKVRWTIVGDGNQLEEVKKNCNIITNGGKQVVNFKGWKMGKDLRNCYLASDIVIGPGRCALEAMACGKPVIAVGSKMYNGLVTEKNWMKGVFTNFGGFGDKMNDYTNGSIERDLDIVIKSTSIRKRLGDLGVFITDQYYNEDVINNNILSIYEIFNKKN